MSSEQIERDRIDRAVARLAEATAELSSEGEPRLGAGPPAPFATEIAGSLEESELERLEEVAGKLEPWLQGPFHLGADLSLGGVWRCDLRWNLLGEHVASDLSGTRVLDVGSNAGYDAFMFAHRGAEVVGCEPSVAHEQAVFLESLYETGVDLRRLDWRALDPGEHGRFDLIHCNGVLHREANPMLLLQALRPMLAERGTMILGTMLLVSSERSEYSRFVPGAFAGDRSWWWVPGRLAFRWMCEAAGYSVEEEFGVSEGPRDTFPVISAYTELRLGEPAQELAGGRAC